MLHEWRAIKSIISRYFGSRYKVWSTQFDRRRHVCHGATGSLPHPLSWAAATGTFPHTLSWAAATSTDAGCCHWLKGNLQPHKLAKAKLPAAKRLAHRSGWGCEPSGANGLCHRCAKRVGVTERIGDPHLHPRARKACHGRAGSAS